MKFDFRNVEGFLSVAVVREVVVAEVDVEVGHVDRFAGKTMSGRHDEVLRQNCSAADRMISGKIRFVDSGLIGNEMSRSSFTVQDFRNISEVFARNCWREKYVFRTFLKTFLGQLFLGRIVS